MDSFKINLKPSAKGCNNPRNPTIFGPRRCCNEAIIFRSNNVKKAILINKGIKKNKNFIKKIKKIILCLYYIFFSFLKKFEEIFNKQDILLNISLA